MSTRTTTGQFARDVRHSGRRERIIAGSVNVAFEGWIIIGERIKKEKVRRELLMNFFCPLFKPLG